MKKIIGLLLIGLLLITGCTSIPVATEPETTEEVPSETNVIPITEEPEDSTTRKETIDGTDITFIEDRGIPELPEGFGIYGASVELEGVYPGWTGTIPITIVNGQDRDRLFVIYVVSPTKPKAGFEALPEEYLYWLTVGEPEVTVGKGEIRQINITLEMPPDTDYAGRRAEVRIRVDDTTQRGLVQIALESKWFITTAD